MRVVLRCVSVSVAAASVAIMLSGAGQVPVQGAPENQQLPGLTVTGVASDHSSAKVYFQPVSGEGYSS